MADILIIDDDIVDREAIKRHLLRPGRDIVIHEATTGQAGLDLIVRKEFGCVFLDYRLPDIDGISLLRSIYNAEMDLTPAPIVMLTGEGSQGVMVDALRWGAQDYLIKGNINADTLNIALAKAREIFELKKNRRQAEDQLRQAQKMEAVGQLTSGVAHDFNNLLTVIMGNSRMLQKKLEGAAAEITDKDLARNILAIEAAARKGTELVRRLMIFTHQRPLHRDVTDINICVQETCDLLQRSLGSAIEVKTIFVKDPWPVQIDVGQLENALINIAVNARDSMPKGGKLTIETYNVMLDEEYTLRNPHVVPGPYAMVAISDTGTGMPPGVVSRIFEPFYTTKAVGEGTGLGLSMVYSFINKSEGYIHVYSEEGHGTVFRIYLPKCPEAEMLLHHAEESPLPQGTETILVVDDNDAVRTVVVGMLEQLGYKVLAAHNGKTAIEVLKNESNKVHLIFTDIVMAEGMNGLELVRKAKEFCPGLKVLFTSGYTENAIPDYQLMSGQELMGKPYRKEDLARKVRLVLDRREGRHAG